jgi:hypothetical protein
VREERSQGVRECVLGEHESAVAKAHRALVTLFLGLRLVLAGVVAVAGYFVLRYPSGASIGIGGTDPSTHYKVPVGPLIGGIVMLGIGSSMSLLGLVRMRRSDEDELERLVKRFNINDRWTFGMCFASALASAIIGHRSPNAVVFVLLFLGCAVVVRVIPRGVT